MDEATYQTRVDDYLAFATSVEHASNPAGINAHLGRAHRDPDYTWDIDAVTCAKWTPSGPASDRASDRRAPGATKLRWFGRRRFGGR